MGYVFSHLGTNPEQTETVERTLRNSQPFLAFHWTSWSTLKPKSLSYNVGGSGGNTRK